MPDQKVRFGLTLPNRGVIIGATTIEELLALTEKAEEAGWDSVWVGDSIFAKPRLDALVLLGALAARTRRVKLGPACFASMPLRNALLLAYQWCCLDFMSNGRTIFVACQGAKEGGGKFEEEFAAFQVDPATRMRRMEEAIEILRLTSSQEHVSYQGQYNQFTDVTVLPRPAQQPIPICVTANPDPRYPKMAERALRRVARYGDGWMTTGNTPASFSPAAGAPPRSYAAVEETVHQLKAAGVPILAGTDAPNPGTTHGASIHRELGKVWMRSAWPCLPSPTSACMCASVIPKQGHVRLGQEGQSRGVRG